MRSPRTPEFQKYILPLVALAVAMWDVAFNVGAFGTIFYNRIFSIWIASTTVLAGCFLMPNQAPIPPLGVVLMGLPTPWFILNSIDSHLIYDLDYVTVFIGVIVYFVSLPYTLWVLFSLTHYELVNLPRKLVLRLGLFIISVGIVGYLMGSHHFWFLTCKDFEISGSHKPDNCRQVRRDSYSKKFESAR